MSYNYSYGSAYPTQQYTTTGQYAAAAAAAAATQQTAASYGYAATTQPGRVVASYQPVAVSYATTGYSAPTVAATTGAGGYGYFQRAAEPIATAYTAPKATSYAAVSQANYGYATTAAAPKTTYASTGTTYKATNYATSASSTSYPSYSKPATTSTAKTVAAPTGTTPASVHQNAYEKVVYNAATSFLTQQSQQSKGTWTKTQKPQFRLHNQKGLGARGPPKPQQLHYCEVCKISCGGPQTYKEHLEGQKHKKKAASSTTDQAKLPRGTYKCDLCDVICTGRDAYGAHVKGANHQKVVKLHQKLGKPIPEIAVPEPLKKAETPKPNVVKTTAPKINFVGGNKLLSTQSGGKVEVPGAKSDGSSSMLAAADDDEEEDAEPVGEDQVEEVKSDVGKVIGYKCNLCDCRFNDTVAKAAHVKGRRHRLAYKKKIDPKLHVSLPKNQLRNRSKGRDGKRGAGSNESVWKMRQQEQLRWEQELSMREVELRRWEEEEYMRRVGEDRYWTRPDTQQMHELEYYEWERRTKFMDATAVKPLFPPNGGPDDRLCMSKHSQIYPTEEELKRVQTIVGSTEKALKMVSDNIAEEEKKEKDKAAPAPKEEPMETDDKTKKPKPLMTASASKDDRTLKGVMRVGVLAKGLLLKGNLNLDQVVLGFEQPPYTLLKKVGKLVPEKLKEVSPDEKYNMSISVVQCAIMITSITEPKTTVKVTLTSPAMREEAEKKEGEASAEKDKKPVAKPPQPKDVLDKEKCLQALAALRHAKWFQARANNLQSCVIVIRLVREMCGRVAAFKPLTGWAVELLCEKALASYPMPLTPGEAFRRVMECLAAGILLPDGPGLMDPCEKDKTDAVLNMSAQERETLTAEAQHYLRLQAFRQLHKVLDVDALKPIPPSMQRKRPGPKQATGASDAKQAKTDDASATADKK